jgi:hypothetical protein
MICTLTARRLKPGSGEDFKNAFEAAGEGAPEEVMKRWKKVYVCRDVRDENVILTFGMFDGTVDELREIQSGTGGEDDRTGAFEPFVDEVLLDGSYEVLMEIEP